MGRPPAAAAATDEEDGAEGAVLSRLIFDPGTGGSARRFPFFPFFLADVFGDGADVVLGLWRSRFKCGAVLLFLLLLLLVLLVVLGSDRPPLRRELLEEIPETALD